jgi:hypothetical protein
MGRETAGADNNRIDDTGPEVFSLPDADEGSVAKKWAVCGQV